MISLISGLSSTPEASQAPQPAPTQPVSKTGGLPKDTVSISPQAHAAAASADVDHDGDSH